MTPTTGSLASMFQVGRGRSRWMFGLSHHPPVEPWGHRLVMVTMMARPVHALLLMQRTWHSHRGIQEGQEE